MEGAAVDLVELTPEWDAAYDAFLLGRDDSLLYYSRPFRRFLTALLGCEAVYWLAVADGEITGVLPMMRRDGPYGAVWNSLPYYGSHGGVLARTAAARAALCRRYGEIARAEGVAAATWIQNPLAPAGDASPVPCDLEDHRIGQISALDAWREAAPPAVGSPHVESSARRNVRKAVTSGVTVRIANDAMAFLETGHREQMEAMGGRAKSPAFFALVPEHFTPGRDYNLYVAEREGRPVAALLVFYFHRTVEYFVPVTVPEARPDQPMALVLATALAQAAQWGYARWNWGGTWPSQAGVYRFKKKWGAVDYPYRYYTCVNSPALYALDPAAIREAYGDFFVIPFHALEPGRGASAP